MKTNSLDFDAQALREKILDLAMRGKLVPQDPDDEPASVLLEKIKAEKAELVKEKKIRKSKPLPPITDDEKPFDIPDSWEWVRLGDVAESINDGIHFKPKYVTSGIPFATAKNISSGILDLSNTDYISEADYNEYKKKVNPETGDLLLSKDGTIGVSAINTSSRKFGLLSSIAVVKTNHEFVSNEFISYAIKSESLQKQIKKNIRGITYRHWNLKRINTTIIPFPPLSEQSRIAAKIAQLFALLRKVESSTQQYGKLQTLLKSKVLDLAMRGKLVKQDPNDEPASVLLESIKAEKAELVKEKKIKKTKPLSPITDDEKLFDIPDSWEWVRLGDVAKKITDGTHNPSPNSHEGKQVISAINIKKGKIDFSLSDRFVTEEQFLNEDTRTHIRKGDILLTIVGSLGNAAIVDTDKLFTAQRSVAIINSDLNSKFLYYVLISKMFRNQIIASAKGTTQKGIYLKKLANLN